MIIRVRRTGKHNTTVKIKLAIGAPSRAIADAESERLRHSVVPIVGATPERRPYLVGSAVLLIHRERKVLATAHHVLSDNEQVPLSIFASDGVSRPFGGTFNIAPEADLAVKHLSADEIAAFSHIPFIQQTDVGQATAAGNRFYAGVAGYPSTRSKRMDRSTLDTRTTVLGGLAIERPSGIIEVSFAKREGMVDHGEHVTPPDPTGMSGGAIFGMALDGFEIQPGGSAKLVGIATRWRRGEKTICGSSVEILTQLLEEIQDPNS